MKKRKVPRPNPALADPALAAPTSHLPGTAAKQALMQARVLAGLPPTLPGDVVLDPEQARVYTRLRNGYDRLEGAQEDRPEAGVKKVVTHGTGFRGDYQRLAMSIKPDGPALGPRLRELRQARGLTLGQVALETGISRPALSHLESGRRRQPHLSLLWLLADFFHLSIDELVGRR